MPDENNNTTDNNTPVAPSIPVDVPVPVDAPVSAEPNLPEESLPNPDDQMKEIASKVSEVHNILIALSSDPSVDEIAAAIGLSICLDRAGKRATSIYSGRTPDVLAFLKPERTFETTADVLKDFVIALDKEKADHLRYKLDGDYVKIFVTPYKTRINEDDLEFSYGDFNIELVLALNVANGTDLDDALREHGRVMHDAVVTNITTGNPGKFGDIEWSDKSASSVSEMAAKLLYNIGGKNALTGEEATAFLTGIVSATDHFSNAKTSATTLEIASDLMKSGADRQLIADNISLTSDNMILFSSGSGFKNNAEEEPATLNIDHNEDDIEKTDISSDSLAENQNEKTETSEENSIKEDDENADLLADLEAAAASLAAGDVTTPEAAKEPLRLDGDNNAIGEESVPTPEPMIPTAPEVKPEITLTPSADFVTDNLDEGTSKYGKMLEEALSESNSNNASDVTAPADSIVSTIPTAPAGPAIAPATPTIPANPAVSAAPIAPLEPEINGVPEINYGSAPSDNILPPPPAPPVDVNNISMPPQIPNNA